MQVEIRDELHGRMVTQDDPKRQPWSHGSIKSVFKDRRRLKKTIYKKAAHETNHGHVSLRERLWRSLLTVVKAVCLFLFVFFAVAAPWKTRDRYSQHNVSRPDVQTGY